MDTHVRLHPKKDRKTIAALRELTKRELRSDAQMIKILLLEALRVRGLVKEPTVR